MHSQAPRGEVIRGECGCMYKRVIRAAKYVYCIYKVHKWVHERASGRSEEARQRLEA